MDSPFKRIDSKPNQSKMLKINKIEYNREIEPIKINKNNEQNSRNNNINHININEYSSERNFQGYDMNLLSPSEKRGFIHINNQKSSKIQLNPISNGRIFNPKNNILRVDRKIIDNKEKKNNDLINSISSNNSNNIILKNNIKRWDSIPKFLKQIVIYYSFINNLITELLLNEKTSEKEFYFFSMKWISSWKKFSRYKKFEEFFTMNEITDKEEFIQFYNTKNNSNILLGIINKNRVEIKNSLKRNPHTIDIDSIENEESTDNIINYEKNKKDKYKFEDFYIIDSKSFEEFNSTFSNDNRDFRKSYKGKIGNGKIIFNLKNYILLIFLGTDFKLKKCILSFRENKRKNEEYHKFEKQSIKEISKIIKIYEEEKEKKHKFFWNKENKKVLCITDMTFINKKDIRNKNIENENNKENEVIEIGKRNNRILSSGSNLFRNRNNNYDRDNEQENEKENKEYKAPEKIMNEKDEGYDMLFGS